MSKFRIILLFLFQFYFVIQANSDCAVSYCGEHNFFNIHYPFRLQGQQMEHNCEYINLTCNSLSQAVVNLPYSGDFYVHYIGYYAQDIELYDANDCLPRRLMNLNLSSSPFEALQYENYTFYSCPGDVGRSQGSILDSDFHIIDCLSNSANYTVLTSLSSPDEMEEMYGCKVILTNSIPVLWKNQFEFSGAYSNLWLKWKISLCKDCEATPQDKSKAPNRLMSKLLAVALSMPAVIVIALFCCGAYCLHLIRMIQGKYDSNARAQNPSTSDQAFQHSMVTIVAPLPQTINVTAGLDESKITSCTELVVLGEGQSTSVSKSSNSCAICLDGYRPEEMVRQITKCEHFFHVKCIDQWLRKNGSCPVCRTLLSDVEP